MQEQLRLGFDKAEGTPKTQPGNLSWHSIGDACTSELVATILRMETNETLTHYFDSISLERLPAIAQHDIEAACPELGQREFSQLMGAVELGRRVAEQKSLARLPRLALSSTTAAVSYCRERFARLAADAVQEEFHIVTLDTKNHVLSTHRITVGTLDASLVHPREVFRPAILDAAASILAVHNHPSGDPTPSKEDRFVTKRLQDVGETIGITLLDHIVVARDGAMSIRELGGYE